LNAWWNGGPSCGRDGIHPDGSAAHPHSGSARILAAWPDEVPCLQPLWGSACQTTTGFFGLLWSLLPSEDSARQCCLGVAPVLAWFFQRQRTGSRAAATPCEACPLRRARDPRPDVLGWAVGADVRSGRRHAAFLAAPAPQLHLRRPRLTTTLQSTAKR